MSTSYTEGELASNASASGMTWEAIWITIGWGAPDFRAGLRAGTQIAFYGMPDSNRWSRADKRLIARLRAVWWMASGGELLDDVLPEEDEVQEVMRTKDHGPNYCWIHHSKELDALVENLREARRAHR